MKKYYYLAILVACTALFTGCQDDLVNKTTYNDGYLHFKFLFDNKGEWKDDDASGPQTRMMAPVEMNLPEGFDMPLYLHCVESNEIETAAEDTPETRGERITGDAFDSRNKIQRFGLYAVVGGEEVLSTYKDTSDPSTKQSSYMEISRSELIKEGEGDEAWNVKEQQLLFDGDGKWTDTKTGNFYGFAPFPGWDGAADASHPAGVSGRTRCIMVNTDDPDHPTINFMMQPEEEYNKDILTAKAAGVTKAQKDAGIELKFKHVLSALKFNLATTNDLKYTVGIGGAEYYLQVKNITIEGIYDQGTMEIGGTAWTVDNTSKGSCTAVLDRSYDDITGDDAEEVKKRINTDEHCMMVLPQTAPTGAKLIITVDLTTDAGGTTKFKENVTFEASLASKDWLPGHSYTYQISKDSRATSYTLTSQYNGVNGGAFSFNVDGSVDSSSPDTDGDSKPDTKFQVTSYAEYSDGGSPTTTPAPWHIEYSEDYDAVEGKWKNWKAGLPLGFRIKNASGEYVGGNSAIPGSTSPVTYTLEAPVRLDGATTFTTLSGNDYTKYAASDGYYDLSLHGIGFSETVCGQTTARNTANCYIINGYGKFKLPLVYGNGMKQGFENPIAYKYAWAKNDTYDDSGLTYPAGHSVFTDHRGAQINHAWLTTQLATAPTGFEARTINTAGIVWTDHNNVIRPGNVKLSDDKDYLCFEIKKEDVQPANIVLYVKDNQKEIAWSWHIWVTANTDFAETKTVKHTFPSSSKEYTMDVAKYDLGWLSPVVKYNSGSKSIQFRVIQNDKMGKNVEHPVSQNGGLVTSDGASIIYQNGRKDPFPNFAAKVKSSNPVGSGNYKVTYDKTNLFSTITGISSVTKAGSMGFSPKYTIQNPGTYILSRQNWFYESGLASGSYDNNQIYGCWNPEQKNITMGGSMGGNEENYHTHTKTIHDPCPVGFMVPNSGLIQMLLNDSPYTSSTTVIIDSYGHTATAPYPYITTKSGLVFYTPGARTMNSTGNGFVLTDFGVAGYFWTAGIMSTGSCAAYFKNDGSTITNASSSTKTVCTGFSVRPIKDDQQGTVAAWSTEPVKNFREANFMNVTLTRNGDTNEFGLTNDQKDNLKVTIGGSEVSLNSLLGNAGMSNKKLLLKNIRVYFDYTGWKTLVETLNPYSIAYGEEKKGSSAFVLLSTIPDHYQFSADWATKYSESTSTPVSTWDWVNLVSLITSRVRITSVVADLRVSYTTTE